MVFDSSDPVINQGLFEQQDQDSSEFSDISGEDVIFPANVSDPCVLIIISRVNFNSNYSANITYI